MKVEEIATDINKVLEYMVSCLQPADPYKVILFGSHANGTPNEHSDIDIMVVLDNYHVSKTYRERRDIKKSVRRLLLEVNRKIPLDVLVYSREELKMLKEYGNYFVDDIEKTGKIIYEKVS